jgi:hypothetical protein
MNQSAVIGGGLIGGFLLYLAMNNRLSVYWSILLGKGGGSSGGGSSGGSGSTTPTPAAPKDYGGGLVQPTSPFNPFGVPIPVPGAGIQTTPGMQGN